jgi:hypothetical protein
MKTTALVGFVSKVVAGVARLRFAYTRRLNSGESSYIDCSSVVPTEDRVAI